MVTMFAFTFFSIFSSDLFLEFSPRIFKWYKISLLSSSIKSTLFLFLPLPRPLRCFFAYFPSFTRNPAAGFPGLGWSGVGTSFLVRVADRWGGDLLLEPLGHVGEVLREHAVLRAGLHAGVWTSGLEAGPGWAEVTGAGTGWAGEQGEQEGVVSWDEKGWIKNRNLIGFG
jgi:hypothetical protein